MTLFQSHGDLAEIDWRHGDEVSRDAAMEQVRVTLKRPCPSDAFIDERASLSYQLGAALIRAGDRSEARTVLLRGLELGPGEFSRMRIATALATAIYYLGGFDESLEWINKAWQSAEKGGFDAYKARILSNRAGIFYGLGRFKDAVDQHALSAQWARRLGSTLEYVWASSGASASLTLIARYESAIAKAREAQNAAEQLGDQREIAKNRELEALAWFHIGNFGQCEQLIREAAQTVRDRGFDDVKPRLDWLLARVYIELDKNREAEELLLGAREVLLGTQDWEDLPGVEIELWLIRARRHDPEGGLEVIREMIRQAESRKAVIVHLRGAVALGEVAVARDMNDGESVEVLYRSLALAERADATEMSWRLSYYLGLVAESSGNLREAQSRFSHALRSLREIADRLSPANRESYLSNSRTKSALDTISRALSN